MKAFKSNFLSTSYLLTFLVLALSIQSVFAIAPIGVSKQAGSPRAIRQGVYDVDFTLIIENFSTTEVAQNIQIMDDINTGLPSGATIVVQAAPLISAGNLTGASNNSFNTSDTRLLDGTGNLGIGEVDTIRYTLRLDMNGASTNYSFSSTATITSTASSPNDGVTGPFTFTDVSDNGTDPDGGDGDDDPTDENDPTVIPSLDLTPVNVGVALRVATPVFVSTGIFDIEYALTIENFSTTKVAENIQVMLSINNGLPSGATVSVQTAPSITVGNLTESTNASFSAADRRILRGSGALAPSLTDTIKYTLRLDLNAAVGDSFTYTSTASLYAAQTGPNDGETGPFTMTDVSQDGSDADGTTANDDPTDDSENTSLTITDLNPINIGIAKSASEPTTVSPGIFNVDFTLTVQNFSTTHAAENIQILDSITSGLPTGATVSVQTAPTISEGNLTGAINGSFGTSNPRILDGNGQLGVGQSDTIKFTLQLDMNAVASSDYGYFNQAIVNAINSGTNDGVTGPFTAEDISHDGTDPDGGDGDNDPTDVADTTFVDVEALVPVEIGIAKNASSPRLVSPNVYDIDYTLTLENFSTEKDAENIQIIDSITVGLPTGATISVQSTPAISINNLGGQANSSFGPLEPRVLAGSGTLANSLSDTIKYTLRIDLTNATGPDYSYFNSAIVSAADSINDGITGPFTAVDTSDNGFDPDGGDANDDPTDQNDTTRIASIELTPYSLGAALQVGTPVAVDAGVFDVTYTAVLENFSTLRNAENIQLRHNVNNGLPSGASATIQVAPSIITGNLTSTVNASFGTGDSNILNGDGTLNTTQGDTIRYTVRYDVTGVTGSDYSIRSSAIVTTTPVGTNDGVTGPFAFIDTSHVGLDPDGSSVNNDPSDASDTTVISDLHRIGVAQEIVDLRSVSNNIYAIDYKVTVENLGTLTLDNIQLTNAIAPGLPSGLTIANATVTTAPASINGLLTVNGAFDGNTNQTLLSGASNLTAGQADTITYSVQIDLTSYTDQIAYIRSAVAATSSSTNPNNGTIDGNTLSIDYSNVGNSPGGSDGNPFNKADSTNIKLPPAQIAIAKGVSETELVSESVLNITYKITVQNIGDFDLPNVQVTDSIELGLPGGVTATILTAPTLIGSSSLATANSSFNGVSDVKLLNGLDTLKIGETDTIQFTMQVDFTFISGDDYTVTNSAIGTASTNAPNDGDSNDYLTIDFSEPGFSPSPDANDDENDLDSSGATIINIQPFVENISIAIPEAFTATINPWTIPGLSSGLYPNNQLKVYNRWGLLVYKAAPYDNNWYGTSTEINSELAIGTYYYVLDYGDGRKPYVGFVYLDR